MKIPKKFELGGQTITVEQKDGLLNDCDSLGQAEYRTNKILLYPGHETHRPMTEDNKSQIFLHELTHWILHIMGESDLRVNEKFVDLFSQLLYQYEKTKVV